MKKPELRISETPASLQKKSEKGVKTKNGDGMRIPLRMATACNKQARRFSLSV